VRDADGVPWCDTCDRFYNPNTLHADGTCPTCGRQVAEPDAPGGEPRGSSAPWHFKLLIAATTVYLGYRLFQGIEWVAHHL
jgi:hypothetical protein